MPEMIGVPAGAGVSANWTLALRVSSRRAMSLGSVAAALAIAASLDPNRRLVVCPLRALTGIPCPVCGGTTAAMDAARLDIRAAFAANPLVVLGAALFAVTPLLLAIGVRRPAGRLGATAIGIALATAEVWQLVRFGVLRI